MEGLRKSSTTLQVAVHPAVVWQQQQQQQQPSVQLDVRVSSTSYSSNGSNANTNTTTTTTTTISTATPYPTILFLFSNWYSCRSTVCCSSSNNNNKKGFNTKSTTNSSSHNHGGVYNNSISDSDGSSKTCISKNEGVVPIGATKTRTQRMTKISNKNQSRMKITTKDNKITKIILSKQGLIVLNQIEQMLLSIFSNNIDTDTNDKNENDDDNDNINNNHNTGKENKKTTNVKGGFKHKPIFTDNNHNNINPNNNNNNNNDPISLLFQYYQIVYKVSSKHIKEQCFIEKSIQPIRTEPTLWNITFVCPIESSKTYSTSRCNCSSHLTTSSASSSSSSSSTNNNNYKNNYNVKWIVHHDTNSNTSKNNNDNNNDENENCAVRIVEYCTCKKIAKKSCAVAALSDIVQRHHHKNAYLYNNNPTGDIVTDEEEEDEDKLKANNGSDDFNRNSSGGGGGGGVCEGGNSDYPKDEVILQKKQHHLPLNGSNTTPEHYNYRSSPISVIPRVTLPDKIHHYQNNDTTACNHDKVCDLNIYPATGYDDDTDAMDYKNDKEDKDRYCTNNDRSIDELMQEEKKNSLRVFPDWVDSLYGMGILKFETSYSNNPHDDELYHTMGASSGQVSALENSTVSGWYPTLVRCTIRVQNPIKAMIKGSLQSTKHKAIEHAVSLLRKEIQVQIQQLPSLQSVLLAKDTTTMILQNPRSSSSLSAVPNCGEQVKQQKKHIQKEKKDQQCYHHKNNLLNCDSKMTTFQYPLATWITSPFHHNGMTTATTSLERNCKKNVQSLSSPSPSFYYLYELIVVLSAEEQNGIPTRNDFHKKCIDSSVTSRIGLLFPKDIDPCFYDADANAPLSAGSASNNNDKDRSMFTVHCNIPFHDLDSDPKNIAQVQLINRTLIEQCELHAIPTTAKTHCGSWNRITQLKVYNQHLLNWKEYGLRADAKRFQQKSKLSRVRSNDDKNCDVRNDPTEDDTDKIGRTYLFVPLITSNANGICSNRDKEKHPRNLLAIDWDNVHNELCGEATRVLETSYCQWRIPFLSIQSIDSRNLAIVLLLTSIVIAPPVLYNAVVSLFRTMNISNKPRMVATAADNTAILHFIDTIAPSMTVMFQLCIGDSIHLESLSFLSRLLLLGIAPIVIINTPFIHELTIHLNKDIGLIHILPPILRECNGSDVLAICLMLLLQLVSFIVIVLPYAITPKQRLTTKDLLNCFILHRGFLYVYASVQAEECNTRDKRILNSMSPFPQNTNKEKDSTYESECRPNNNRRQREFNSYWDYYFNLHGIEIRYPRLPLLAAHKVEKHNDQPSNDTDCLHLVPELCCVLPIRRDFLYLMGVVDKFMPQLEREVNIKLLSGSMLRSVIPKQSSDELCKIHSQFSRLVDEATQIHPTVSYQRLEFLGDPIISFYLCLNVFTNNAELQWAADEIGDIISVAGKNTAFVPTSLRLGLPRLLQANHCPWRSAYRKDQGNASTSVSAIVPDAVLSDVFESFIAATYLSGEVGSHMVIEYLNVARLQFPSTLDCSMMSCKPFAPYGPCLKTGYPFHLDNAWNNRLSALNGIISEAGILSKRLTNCTCSILEKLHSSNAAVNMGLIDNEILRQLLCVALFDDPLDHIDDEDEAMMNEPNKEIQRDPLITIALVRDSLFHIGVWGLKLCLATEAYNRFPLAKPTDLHMTVSSAIADDVLAYLMVKKGYYHDLYYEDQSYAEIEQQIIFADCRGQNIWDKCDGWWGGFGIHEFVKRSKHSTNPQYPGISGGRFCGREKKLPKHMTEDLAFSFKAIFGAFVMAFGLERAWQHHFVKCFDEILLLSSEELRFLFSDTSTLVRSY